MPIKQVATNLIRAGHIKLGTKKSGDRPGRNAADFRIELEEGQPEGLRDKIEERFGKNPNELKIYFPKIFENSQKSRYWAADDQYEDWGGKKLACYGDGETALRKAVLNEETGKVEGWNNEWTEVPCTCNLINLKGACSQIGRLRVGLHGLPFTGFFEITTHSWHAIRGLRAIIDMYFLLLKDDFFKTPFILYKEQKVLKGYPQYIVGIKIDPEFAKNLPAMESMEFSIDGEDDEAIVEIPEGFQGDDTQEAAQQPKSSGRGRGKKAEKQASEPVVDSVGEHPAENAAPESQPESETEVPFTPDPVEPDEQSSEPASSTDTATVQEISDTDALNEAYRIAELEDPVSVINSMTSKDGKVLMLLANSEEIPYDEVNKAAQDKIDALMDEETVEVEEAVAGELKPETLETDYGFERAKEIVMASEEVAFIEGVASLGSGRMKIVAKRRLTELKKQQDTSTTQTTPPKAQAQESPAKSDAKKSTDTTTKTASTDTTSKASQEKPATAAAKPETAKDTAKTASPSERNGMSKLREDKLKISVSEYKGKGNFPESIDELILKFAGKPLAQLTDDELMAEMKKFKAAVEAVPFKPLDE